MAGETSPRSGSVKLEAKLRQMSSSTLIGLTWGEVKILAVLIPRPSELKQVGLSQTICERRDPGAGMGSAAEAPIEWDLCLGSAARNSLSQNFTGKGAGDADPFGIADFRLAELTERRPRYVIGRGCQCSCVTRPAKVFGLVVAVNAGRFISPPGFHCVRRGSRNRFCFQRIRLPCTSHIDGSRNAQPDNYSAKNQAERPNVLVHGRTPTGSEVESAEGFVMQCPQFGIKSDVQPCFVIS